MGKRVNCSSNFRPKKCAKKSVEEKDDRISELPDEILVSILSMLTLMEAARSTVLSKRWTNLWTFTSHLDFWGKKLVRSTQGKDSYLQKTNDYIGWVNHVLKLHKSSRLDTFKIAFPLNNSFGQDINRWMIEFAFAKNVKNLELHLWPIKFGKPYAFLDISLPDHSQLGFRSLQTLHLNNVSMIGQVLQFFLHNCQFLEELIVHDSSALLSLEVSSPTLALKHLEVCYCNNMESIVISDTNLVSLTVINAGALWLEKVPSLVHVNVGDAELHFWADVFTRLSCCLSQLLRLTLVMDDMKKLLKRHKFPQLTKLNELVFDVCIMNNKSMLACTRLIHAAPFLKKVVLKVDTFLEARTDTKKFRKVRRCPLPDTLEVVEIYVYSSTRSQLQLVMYFLENAVALKKIIIDPRLHDSSFACSDDDEFESTSRLLAKQQFEGVVVPPHVELVLL